VICGNSDYIVDFVFDSEWDLLPIKTARFKVNGEYTDVVFEGNSCSMPIIYDAKTIWVGVFAGNLSTTSPAIVYCKPSILDGTQVPAPPREDVYNQIIEILNNQTLGKDGVSPIVSLQKIDRGHRLSITDAEGTLTFDILDGINGADGKDGADGADYIITEADYAEIAQLVYDTKMEQAEDYNYGG
jgi:hypothetical protein